MAYFAKIETGKVAQVIVCDSKALCERLFPGKTWVETKMDAHYAGIGYLHHADTNTLTTPRPYPSWALSTEKTDWVPPVVRPKGTITTWDEKEQAWVPT